MKNAIPTVRNYMTPAPYTIAAGETLSRAHTVMRARRIRHLPVVRAGELVGVVSQRDLALMETLQDVNPDEVTVEEAMSPIAYAVSQDAPFDMVVREMAEQKYGSAVVTHNGAVVGIVTTIDVCRALVDVWSRPRTPARPAPPRRKRAPAGSKKTEARSRSRARA